MNITCTSCRAVFNNPREVAMPLAELQFYAALCGWIGDECGPCVRAWFEDVERKFQEVEK